MDSTSTPSTTGSSVRGKCDPAWSHVLEEVNDGKSSFKCLYCGKVYKGGGINRIKRHLAGVKVMWHRVGVYLMMLDFKWEKICRKLVKLNNKQKRIKKILIFHRWRKHKNMK